MTEKYFENLGNEYLAHFSRRLSDLIIEQASSIMQEASLVTPTTAISTIMFLVKQKSATVAFLAEQLGVSHQMATQRINALEKLDLVKRIESENDKRTKNVALTQLGQKEAKIISTLTKQFKTAFDSLEDEIDCHLAQMIRTAEKALLEKPLRARALNK